MSRFAACPVCGINMAMHLLALHTDAHFTGEEVVRPQPSRVSEARSVVKPPQENTTSRPPQENTTSSQERLAPSGAEVKQDGGGYAETDLASTEPATRRPESEDARQGEATAPGRGLSQGWSFMKSPSAKDVRGPRRSRKAFDLPLQPFDYLVVLDFEVLSSSLLYYSQA